MWRFGYNLQQPRLMHISSQSMAAMASTQMINAMLDEFRPDLVVSVHPLMQQFPLHVLKHRIRYRISGFQGLGFSIGRQVPGPVLC